MQMSATHSSFEYCISHNTISQYRSYCTRNCGGGGSRFWGLKILGQKDVFIILAIRYAGSKQRSILYRNTDLRAQLL